jgi:hypothetical protein
MAVPSPSAWLIRFSPMGLAPNMQKNITISNPKTNVLIHKMVPKHTWIESWAKKKAREMRT